MKVEFKDKKYKEGVIRIGQGYTTIVIVDGVAEIETDYQLKLAKSMGGKVVEEKTPKQKRGKK